MTKTRKFRISSLPQDKVYINLDNKFRKRFFKKLYNNVGGSTILSRIIKRVKREEVRRWKVGIRFIPLWALLSLNGLLGKDKFSIDELEKNIISYRSKYSRKIILNPKLPITEDKRLIRVVTHLICDGYGGGKSHPPAYNNTEKTLIDKFIQDLEIFGGVPIKSRERIPPKGNKILYTLEFPRIFTYILRHLYKIKFGSKVSRLPEYFFNLPDQLAFQVIKSFADDESCVGETFIAFISSNHKLLKDLRRLIILKLHISSKNITEVKYVPSAKTYNFRLKRKALDVFYKHVNFTHPRKRKMLEFILSRKSTPGSKFKIGEAKRMIFEILSRQPTTAIELALKLGIRPKNIRFHLYKLKNEGKIIESHKTTYGSTVWRVVK